MGILCGSNPQMRFSWAVTLLLQFILSTNGASPTGQNGVSRVRSTVPISILNSMEENDAAPGHCGIIFHGTSTAQQIEQNKQRQVCFALQSHGFLTRYMRHEQNEASSWGYDVCLLLAFCGSECHRLYGHPQKTAAATNALTEAEAAITGNNASYQHDTKETSHVLGDSPNPNRTEHGSIIHREPQADDRERTVPNHTEWDAAAPKNQARSLEMLDNSRFHSCSTQKYCNKCARHFMSHAWRVRCKGVYSLEFEAQNQGFGRFFARLALLIGAADIEEVVDIERELKEYIRAKTMRVLKGPSYSPSRQVSGQSQHGTDPPLPLAELARPSEDVLKSSGLPESHERAISPANGSYASTSSSGLLNNELKIVLEPLLSNGDIAGSLENTQLDKSVPTIRISIPPAFRARLAPVTTQGSSMAHTRRLRGTSARDSANSETWVGHKPFPAGSTLSSAGHCKAAAGLMSQRSELHWLTEYIFFLPHRG